MIQKNAILFPAFVTEFIGTETDELRALGVDIQPYLELAAKICGNGILNFDVKEKSFVQDEEMIQYITYIYSCAVSDVLKKGWIYTDFIAGYSMGIYAALYHARSLSFVDGLNAIQAAYCCIKTAMPPGDFTMGLTGGLEMDDVQKLLKTHGPATHIINSNNPHTFVYSGPVPEIEAIIHAAREEGALMTRVMNVSIPYHSPYLENAAEVFAGFLDTLDLEAPEWPITSSLDQSPLITAENVRTELYKNLAHPFDWFNTVRHFLDQGATCLYECGAGEGLTKINKFIDGDYKTINLKSLRKYLAR
jgi:malonyl CoA-acyl carrier protein transacylase